MSRQDQYAITVVVEGIGNLGVFDKLTGGEVDSEETKYRPGAMGEMVTLGGSKTVGNVTVSRLYDLTRDHPIIGRLFAAAGQANVVVSKQPLDVNKNVRGAPITYKGKLKAVTPPEADSESSDAALLEIEISSAVVS